MRVAGGVPGPRRPITPGQKRGLILVGVVVAALSLTSGLWSLVGALTRSRSASPPPGHWEAQYVQAKLTQIGLCTGAENFQTSHTDPGGTYVFHCDDSDVFVEVFRNHASAVALEDRPNLDSLGSVVRAPTWVAITAYPFQAEAIGQAFGVSP